MSANVLENLKSFGINVEHRTNEEKIIKTRYIDERYNHHILRLDREAKLYPFRDILPQGNYDAVVISYYDKGFLTSDKILQIVETYHCPIFIDSKKTNLPVEYAYIKINDDEYSKLDKELKDSPNLIVTKGSQGVDYQGKNYPAVGVSVFDVCGAGDTFLSALVYFFLLYGKIEKAIPYANKAAAIAVTHFGTYVLSERDVNEICG